jgi:hypothetical protein
LLIADCGGIADPLALPRSKRLPQSAIGNPQSKR